MDQARVTFQSRVGPRQLTSLPPTRAVRRRVVARRSAVQPDIGRGAFGESRSCDPLTVNIIIITLIILLLLLLQYEYHYYCHYYCRYAYCHGLARAAEVALTKAKCVGASKLQEWQDIRWIHAAAESLRQTVGAMAFPL